MSTTSHVNYSSYLNLAQQAILGRSDHGCQQCSIKRSRARKSKSMHTVRPRVYCDIVGCTSSFRRFPDLNRHKRSLHGPKQPCAYRGCQYATGRVDKMNEHIRKNHKETESQGSKPRDDIATADNFQQSQVFDELDMIGFEWQADDWLSSMYDIDGMAKSQDSGWRFGLGPFYSGLILQ